MQLALPSCGEQKRGREKNAANASAEKNQSARKRGKLALRRDGRRVFLD